MNQATAVFFNRPSVQAQKKRVSSDSGQPKGKIPSGRKVPYHSITIHLEITETVWKSHIQVFRQLCFIVMCYVCRNNNGVTANN